MARGGKQGVRGSKRSQANATKRSIFNHGIPNPLDNPASSEDSQNWIDHYHHPARASFDCMGCDKTYATLHHLTSHERECFSNKRHLSSLLEESKLFWEAKKRRRLEILESSEAQPCTSEHVNQGIEYEAPSSGELGPSNVNSEHEMDEALAPLLPRSSNLGPREGSTPDVLEQFSDLEIPVANRKSKRTARLPSRYRDNDALLEPPAPLEAAMTEEDMLLASVRPASDAIAIENRAEASGIHLSAARSGERSLLFSRSKRNLFGVVRSYALPAGAFLTHDPERAVTLPDLTDARTPKQNAEDSADTVEPKQWVEDSIDTQTSKQSAEICAYGPFKSKTAFLVADWYWGSTNKSFSDFQKLVNIMKQPGFSVDDVISVNWSALFKCLGANRDDLTDYDGAWIVDDGWKSTPIFIDVPFHNRMKSNKGTEKYLLGNLRHRSIVAVIKEKITSARDSSQFHYHPYRATWQRNTTSPEVELYGEFYYSREFRSADEELQRLALPEQPADLERVIVALMIWSDGTHLSSFSPASLWPCYLYFGNESKYRRCKPSGSLGYHIAYFEKLPDVFTEYLKERNGGKMPADSLFSHCVREAFHSQWAILLDQELQDAMKRGLRILCPDGKERLFFPRLFTYSADYPEKALVAGIRNNGISPCHRCLVPKEDLSRLGAPSDVERNLPRSDAAANSAVTEARKEIYEAGYAVDTPRVEERLKPLSLVPTLNTFNPISTIQIGHPFSINDALTVDLMHEFEIGSWKRLFIHLIRLLHTFSTATTTLTAELDSRYRAMPPFGRDTIRKFGLNASDMKRKAARDFEDLLQCAISAFESLLPEPYNSCLMKLLYIFAYWHALAKLRLHNDFTLACLDYATVRLGAQTRCFDQAIAKIPTKELPKEADARARKEGKGKAKHEQKPAPLGIFTIKFHFLGDYVASIKKRGTTDSYSTETGELAHRLPKSWYGRTDRRDFKGQMTQIERRQARLSQIRTSMETSDSRTEGKDKEQPSHPHESFPDRRYALGASQNEPLDLSLFAVVPGTTNPDKHLTDFLPSLQRHLLPRIAEKLGFRPDAIPESDAVFVAISDHRLYNHQLLRLYYTTYDVRREEDVVHVDTPQCNIMLLNSAYAERTWETEHPYIYGKVNGVFHANVSFVGVLPNGTRNYTQHRLDFAWVHWYQRGPVGRELELDTIFLVPLGTSSALGFVDPADILRAVHIMPRYSKGKTGERLRSRVVKNLEFWNEYYVNRFADRDLFMRYQYGMSVGHTYMHGSDWPPPNIPQVPAGFDHHIQPTAAVTPPNAIDQPMSVIVDPISESPVVPVIDPQPASLPVSLHSHEEPEVEENERDDHSNEHDHQGEEESYWDDFNDRELMHYNEMYGFDEDFDY